MSTYESLSHSKWDCKYHVVFVPKRRKKTLYGKVRKFLGSVFHELASQRRSEILEGHMVQDHVHRLIRIPPKYAVAEVVGYIKGKAAIAQGATHPAYYWLVAIAIAGVVMSLYYYFGVVRVIFWSKDVSDLSPIKTSKPIRLSLYACVAGMFFLGLFPSWIVNLAGEAVKALH